MQYLTQKIYFFLKIFGKFKKKLYLCTLNCDFYKTAYANNPLF